VSERETGKEKVRSLWKKERKVGGSARRETNRTLGGEKKKRKKSFIPVWWGDIRT